MNLAETRKTGVRALTSISRRKKHLISLFLPPLRLCWWQAASTAMHSGRKKNTFHLWPLYSELGYIQLGKNSIFLSPLLFISWTLTQSVVLLQLTLWEEHKDALITSHAVWYGKYSFLFVFRWITWNFSIFLSSWKDQTNRHFQMET